MIDPATINLSSLPSVALADRKSLPEQSAIYFAIDSRGTVQYIGQSRNLRQRWLSHNLYGSFSECCGIRVSYLFVDSDLLRPVEAALIDRFDPPLNSCRPSMLGGENLRLRLLRTRKGLTTADVASRLGIADSTVRNWEKGRTLPRMYAQQFQALLDLYEVDFGELLSAISESGN